MTTEIRMPALSPTMEKGTLAKWLVAPGDSVKAGDMLAEIETDKATMEMEADADGRIAAILIPEGSPDVSVGTVIATLAEGDEAIAPAAAATPEAAIPERELEDAVAGPITAAPIAPAPAPAPVPAPDAPAIIAPAQDQGANATPLARRIAAFKGIDLAGIAGTGPRGKIVKADLGLEPAVAAPAATVPAAYALATAAILPPPAGVPVRSEKLSTMRKTIARRLTESKQTVPHFYLTARCQLDALLALRAEINGALGATGVKVSVNDMLIKAMARALEEVPDANVQFGGDELHRFDRVDIAMAVAIDGGLVTPVIRDAGGRSLAAIARDSKALSAKARDGKLTPEDYTGGTATISNLGMFGIDEMFPVINLPQAMILGIGAGIEQPWKVDDAIGLATIMAATASFDHRAIDGAVAAQFMAALREFVETPLLSLS
ncbi:dihydrolipoamide acetyltransferase family protein [Novosphingobium colocasiae]|uniref:Dihydrolipoamide acetyltransferase component of pyruvate dehydrogenase complex n=1 Tax=Novosphingobium colocasiae TaxID=1256513 RepID=A0A918P9E6_9SPHN|nr:dihydrolipoamide acetyltransferase family protein [Novosphingobium colocasiae]GGY90314.1 acetyltransferase component of pyruvate dehydrogenase complex [Novosphingobium colocasiae]